MCNEHCEDLYDQVSATKDKKYPILILLSGKEKNIKVHELIKGNVYVY